MFAAEDEEPPRGFIRVTSTEEGTTAALGQKRKFALCYRRGVAQGGMMPVTRVVVCPSEAVGESMGVDDGFEVIRSTYQGAPLPPDFPCVSARDPPSPAPAHFPVGSTMGRAAGVCFERGQDLAPLTRLRLTSSTSAIPGMERHKCPLSTAPNLWLTTNTVGLDLPYSCLTPGGSAIRARQ